ncbi:MAG: hypothetical protein JW703_02420 [Candidatus Diapherotrites archaeon]|nr:hypothetical protein [Candidatus Diapherotrites archaeon]
MKANNPILLIVLQNQGIHYNDLLNKLSSSYSSTNSARAALSRALKDLSVLGFLTRKENHIYVTDKAMVSLQSEMKNKLIAKLNELMASKNNVKEIALIVQQLQVLIQRSKNDSSLLKVSRTSTNFYLKDLKKLDKNTEKEINHLIYLKKIFSEQIKELEELDFNDLMEKELNEKTIEFIEKKAKEFNLNEISFEFSSVEEKEKILPEAEGKTKTNKAVLALTEAKEFLKKLSKNPFKNKIVLYLSPLKIELKEKKVIITGPYTKIGVLK